MTREELDKVMETIKSHFHIDYVGNGYPKKILTTDNLNNIERELEKLVNAKKEH